MSKPTYEEIAQALQDALYLIDNADPHAWANGNTHPDYHGPDEGEVHAASMRDRIAAVATRAGLLVGV